MRDSINTLNHTGESGNKNQRTIHALQGRVLEPDFQWRKNLDSGDRKADIIGDYTRCGDSLLRLPFRLNDANRNANGGFTLFVSDEWTIDLDTTTVDLTTFTGGIIDNTSLVVKEDWFVWAFMDPFDSTNTKFKGFGVTKRPNVTNVTVFSGGTVGSSTVLTFPSSNASSFVVGARVIVRASALKGSAFNQGIITDVTQTTLTVTLDTDYGAATENNGTVSGTGNTVIQTDKFEPKMSDELSLYPGGGTEYQFCYMGHMQTDENSDILRLRYRGEKYNWAYAFATVIHNQTGLSTPGTTTVHICLARWVPLHARRARFQLAAQRSAGSGIGSILILSTDGWKSGNVSDVQVGNSNAVTGMWSRAHDDLSFRYYDHTIALDIIISSSTLISHVIIEGYENERHF